MSTRGSIATLAIAAVLAVAVLALAPGSAVASEPDSACAGSGGGALFVADSNFTVANNASPVAPNGSSFPDDRTIRFRNVTLASNASTFLRLENGTGPESCVANVSATNDSILIAPDGETNVSVRGNVSTLALADADYGSGSADLAYNATEAWTITLYDTSLGSGTDVNAVTTGDGSNLVSNATDGSGNLTLTLPGGNHSVDLREDSGDGGGGDGPVFIPAPPSGDGDSGGSPDFSIAAISLDASEVGVGETVTVAVRVENDGDADGEFTGSLTADGQDVDSASVTVNENYHADLSLSTAFDQPGTYQLAVDGEAAGSVEVTGEPDLSIASTSLGSTDVAPGEAATITATVENQGTAEGEVTVPLAVGDEEIDSQSVAVGAGETATVTFEHTFEEPGSKTVTVDGEEAGTVAVAEQSDQSDGGGSDGGSGDGGGDGPPLALVGGLLIVLAVGGVGGYYWYDPEGFEELLNR